MSDDGIVDWEPPEVTSKPTRPDFAWIGRTLFEAHERQRRLAQELAARQLEEGERVRREYLDSFGMTDVPMIEIVDEGDEPSAKALREIERNSDLKLDDEDRIVDWTP
ncbi:hypothetical protein [Candidatus Nephthysia bennettiae]|uniref:Uncharacterized protein n=1 Tax=Candidatus Nephthysia bennettiae TaxID=3127016 RepID=A0A934K5I9_9BACT|nr:hypothetical protein [Candidatus Dormibacteraeota bacterium]MBJ7611917.1 hypothetical protein [Candidatus Dormibacteraeota bacterium]